MVLSLDRCCQSDWQILETVADALRSEHIVILPTDTIYGISGIVPATDQKIRKIKGRGETKPFIQLIAAPELLSKYTDISVPSSLLAFWPGPLTLIVPDRNGGTTAYRCPGDAWLRSVIDVVGEPLYSTSVNFSGLPSYTKITDITAAFEPLVDLIVADGDCANPLPSTIVSLCDENPVIIRKGAITGLEKTGLFT